MKTNLILAAIIGCMLQCGAIFGGEGARPEAQPSTPQIEKLIEVITALTKRLQAVEELVDELNDASGQAELVRLKQLEVFVNRDAQGQIVTGTFYCGGGYHAFLVFANLDALSNVEKVWFAYESAFEDSFLTHFVGSQSLRELYLASPGFTDGSIKHVKHINSLKVLGIGGSSITENGIEELRKARPDVKVIKRSLQPPFVVGRPPNSGTSADKITPGE